MDQACVSRIWTSVTATPGVLGRDGGKTRHQQANDEVVDGHSCRARLNPFARYDVRVVIVQREVGEEWLTHEEMFSIRRAAIRPWTSYQAKLWPSHY